MFTYCITPPRRARRPRNPQPARRAAYLGLAAGGRDAHEIEDPGQVAALDLTGCDAIARESQPLPAAARQPGTPARRQDQEAAD